MDLSGIERIDKLFAGAPDAREIKAGDADAEAVGAVQDFLSCHGLEMPDIRSSAYGKFGPKTVARLKEFRLKFGLQKKPDEVKVDTPTMKKLVDEPARFPRATRGYVTLVLDLPFTGLMRVLSFVAIAEGAGKFTAINTGKVDKQGLSYGLLQWAQRQTRLHDIVNAFQTQQPALFKSVFGLDADGMVTHVGKPNGGLDANGQTPAADKKFDLVNPPWKQRFINAGRERPLQKVQLDVALTKFRTVIADVRGYAPVIRSERGFAFMIDMANHQGDAGARRIFEASFTTGMTEAAALGKMVEKSVEKVKEKFKQATRDRRNFFRTSPLFADTDFNEN